MRAALAAVARILRAGHVGGPVVGGHRHAAVGAGHRDRLHEPPDLARPFHPASVAPAAPLAVPILGDLEDAHVVVAASGRHGPEEAAVWRERAAGGQIPEARQLPVWLEQPAAWLDPVGGPYAPVVRGRGCDGDAGRHRGETSCPYYKSPPQDRTLNAMCARELSIRCYRAPRLQSRIVTRSTCPV